MSIWMLVRSWRSLQRKSWAKFGQGPSTSAAGSAPEQKKKTAKTTATLVRENEEIKNNFRQ